MKSLLQLLKDEDRAFNEYEARRQGFNNLAKNNASPDMVLEFKRLVSDEKKRLDDSREDIREYFRQIRGANQQQEPKKPEPNKIVSFVWMLANQAEMGKLSDECAGWNMSKEDMFECVGYLADMLGICVW